MAAGQKKTPSERLESLERWSGWATLLILCGIVLEIGNLFWFPHHQTNWELVSAIAALLAIGFGLAVEYICILGTIKASGEEKLESDAKLTEALNRAAKAQEDLVKYLTPRRLLLAPYQSKVVAALKPFSGTKYDIGFGTGDGEQADIVWDIEDVLKAAGWIELIWGVHGVGVMVNQRGTSGRPIAGSVAAQNVEIHLDATSRQQLLPAANALASALNGIEIKASVVPSNVANTHTDAMHVLIGPKR